MAIVLKRNRLEIWRDVIFALFIRELKSGFNDKFGLAWAIINPLSFIVVLSLLRGRMDGGLTHTMPTFIFMAVGMLTVQLFMSMITKTASSIKKNKPLFAFRQVQPISGVLASVLFDILIKLTLILAIGVFIYFLDMDFSMADPLLFMFSQLLIVVVSFSIGLICAVSACYVEEVQKVLSVVMRPMLFISAVFFSLQDIPKDYWKFFLWNPVVHAIELSRQAMFPNYGAVGVNLSVLFIMAISLLFIALAYYHSYWKQAISR